MFWLYSAVDHGDGAADAHKGMAGKALPVHHYQRQHRHHEHTDQGQLPVDYQHQHDDGAYRYQFGQGQRQQLESLLQLQHVGLHPRT